MRLAPRHLIGLAAALVSALTLSWAPRALACSVMIDTSGSMQGFVASARFTRVLSTLARLCTEHFSFGGDLKSAPASFENLSFRDPETRLGPSLQEWTHRSHERRLYVLTDNVADNGSGHTDPGQAEFYRLLRDPQLGFGRIAAVLMRVPFSGRIFSADDKGHGDYPSGPRALMLYVLDRGAGEPGFAPASLGLPAADLSVIALKPFEPAGEALDAELSSNARDVSFEDGVITLSRKSAGETYTFALTARVRPSQRWDFGGLPLSANLVFPASPPFTSRVVEPCSVTPATAPHGREVFQVSVSCTAPSATASVPESVLRQLGNRRAERHGFLVVSVRATSAQIRLGPALKAWSFDGDGARLAEPDPAVQGAIYKLGELLTDMSPPVVRPMVMSAPVTERLFFFDAKPFVIGGALAAALGALAWLAVSLSAPRTAEVSGGAGGAVRKDVRGVGVISVPLADRQQASVWVTPAAVLVLGGGGVRLLPAGGGQADLGRSGRLNVRVREKPKVERARPRKPARTSRSR